MDYINKKRRLNDLLKFVIIITIRKGYNVPMSDRLCDWDAKESKNESY